MNSETQSTPTNPHPQQTLEEDLMNRKPEEGLHHESDDEINFLDYWIVIWNGRRAILLLVFIIVTGTTVYSLFMPNVYQATAVISPVQPKGARESISSAMMQDLGFGLTPGGSSSAEIVSFLESNILREKMIEHYRLLPVLFPEQWDEERKAWKTPKPSLINSLIGTFRSNTGKETKHPGVWDGLRSLKTIIRVKRNIKENSITLKAEFPDPAIAAKIVNYLLLALNDHMSSEAKRVAQTNMKYLEAQVDKTPDPFIKQKIYNLIAQQIETSMMAEAKENFAFKIIDPPKEPDRKVRPKRALIVMSSFALSLFLGIVFVILREYLKKSRAIKAGPGTPQPSL